MEKFDRENIDELLEICQIHQYFPRQILCHMVPKLNLVTKLYRGSKNTAS